MKKYSLCVLSVLALNISFSQTVKDDAYLSWSAVRRLTPDDFAIKTSSLPNTSSYGQFSMQFEIDGFAFMKKNFNKKVHNYFLRVASWIDTSYDINLSVRYQQTLFDICEIYTRQFRKALKENKSRIREKDFAGELNAKAMADFAKRRLEYDNDTKSGTDKEKQVLWEEQIQKELSELRDFSNE